MNYEYSILHDLDCNIKHVRNSSRFSNTQPLPPGLIHINDARCMGQRPLGGQVRVVVEAKAVLGCSVAWTGDDWRCGGNWMMLVMVGGEAIGRCGCQGRG